MKFVTRLLNCMIRSGAVYVVLIEGILTQIHMKGDITYQGNYRNIIVTPVLLTILEHILNCRHNKILEGTQSMLQ